MNALHAPAILRMARGKGRVRDTEVVLDKQDYHDEKQNNGLSTEATENTEGTEKANARDIATDGHR
jgi:hypothetical protein